MAPVPERGLSVALTPQAGGTLRVGGCTDGVATLSPLPAPTPQSGTGGRTPTQTGAVGCHEPHPRASAQGRGLGAPTPRPLAARSPRDPLPAGQVSHSRRETESRGGEATWQSPRWGAHGRATAGATSACQRQPPVPGLGEHGAARHSPDGELGGLRGRAKGRGWPGRWWPSGQRGSPLAGWGASKSKQ